MLPDEVAEGSTIEWSSLVVFAPTKISSLRFRVDHGRLGVITVRHSHPIATEAERTASLGKTAIFSTLDANSGYWQIEIDEKDRTRLLF